MMEEEEEEEKGRPPPLQTTDKAILSLNPLPDRPRDDLEFLLDHGGSSQEQTRSWLPDRQKIAVRLPVSLCSIGNLYYVWPSFPAIEQRESFFYPVGSSILASKAAFVPLALSLSPSLSLFLSLAV